MEVNNLRELRKALKNHVSPITSRDSKVIRFVTRLEVQKKSTVYLEDSKCEVNKLDLSNDDNKEILYGRVFGYSKLGNPAISVTIWTTIILSSCVMIISLYAIYKNRNLRIIYKKDGTVELSVE